MTTTDTPTSKTWATRHWSRWRETSVLASLFGTSWRRLHSPTLFLWARALQPSPRHWPETSRELSWRVSPSLIEVWRSALKRNTTWMSRTDLGAGQRRTGKKKDTVQVAELAKRSLTPESDVLAICRWLKCLKPEGSFLELGTSLGVTSAYVASVGWRVETWEGCEETLRIAREGWNHLGLDGVISARRGLFSLSLQICRVQHDGTWFTWMAATRETSQWIWWMPLKSTLRRR